MIIDNYISKDRLLGRLWFWLCNVQSSKQSQRGLARVCWKLCGRRGEREGGCMDNTTVVKKYCGLCLLFIYFYFF